MARNLFRIFTENNPVMGDSKTFCIPEAKGLTSLDEALLRSLSYEHFPNCLQLFPWVAGLSFVETFGHHSFKTVFQSYTCTVLIYNSASNNNMWTYIAHVSTN